MTSLTLEEQVLKADRRGRVRVPRERREALLAEFRGSGVSAAEFARLTGLRYSTFAGWVARARRQEAARVATAPAPDGKVTATGPLVEAATPWPAATSRGGAVRLFEAVVEAPRSASGPLPVELPGGARLLLAEPAQVPLAAELLAALAQKGGRPC